MKQVTQEQWEVKRFGDICELKKGKQPVLKKIQEKGDLPYLVARYLRGNESPLFASENDVNSVKISRQDLFIICDGSNSGETFSGFEGILSSTMALIKHSAELETKFLRYFLQTHLENFSKSKTGSAIPHLDLKGLRELTLRLPPLAEQKRIVAILDKAFVAIATAEENAEKNLQNAREIFESYLQSVFENNGEEWMKKRLEEVLTVQPQNGWSPPAANHADSGTPVLTLSSVTGFVFRPDKRKYTSAKTDPKARYWIQNGDLLITRSNTPDLVGHVAIASGIERPTIYPDLIMRMNPDPTKALAEFLYYQLRCSSLREEITGRAQGANPTMKKISGSAVRTLPISLPPLSKQRAIVAKLNTLSAETQQLVQIYERKQATLSTLKQSLLQKAFKGELTGVTT